MNIYYYSKYFFSVISKRKKEGNKEGRKGGKKWRKEEGRKGWGEKGRKKESINRSFEDMFAFFMLVFQLLCPCFYSKIIAKESKMLCLFLSNCLSKNKNNVSKSCEHNTRPQAGFNVCLLCYLNILNSSVENKINNWHG